MSQYTGLNLAIPSPPTRQTGVGILGSPISLSRSVSLTSNSTDTRTPEEVLRDNLLVYKTFLEHEIQFIDSEINALIERPISGDSHLDASFMTLRNGLKIRFNTLQVKKARVDSLLEVL